MKNVLRILTTIAALAVLAGCTKSQLVRFAPPGIIKYEELAGDQPQNPIIAQRIADRAGEDDKPFPVLSQTPSQQPVRALVIERGILQESLEGARNDLEAATIGDRRAAEEESAQGSLLPDARDRLLEGINRDKAAAARERKGQRPSGAPSDDGTP